MNHPLSNHTIRIMWVFPYYLHILMCGLFLFLGNSISYSQGGLNNGASINSQSGSVLNVQGAVINNGILDADGAIRLTGDWVNNGAFTAMAGSVILEGGAQTIGGTNQSAFNNLELLGAGVKTMALDASSSGILALNNSELATDSNTFSVINTSTGAITRANGYVSSLLGGSLSRETATTGVYLFPIGSSMGTPRYRPTEITPASTAANTFTAIFYNYIADNDNWFINLKTPDIGVINPLFYTEIKRPVGTDPATISMFYDEIFDDTYTGLAHWSGGQWNSVSGVTMVPGALNRITRTGWANFSTAPWVITKDSGIVIIPPVPTDELFIYNTFTPDDNGQNDTWQIDNIDQYPNNSVKVFNRWGGLVYEATPYVNDWDGTRGGEQLPVTAYYYIVNLGDESPAYTGTVNIAR